MMICPKGGNSMTTLIQYLQRVLIVAIPAILVFLCFTPYRMKALSAMNLRTSHRHEAGLILFVTSIFGILALTLWPTYIWMDSPGVWGDIRILIDRPSWKSNLSLIPFTVFKDYIEDLFKTPEKGGLLCQRKTIDHHRGNKNTTKKGTLACGLAV